jgi:hypothetical protein
VAERRPRGEKEHQVLLQEALSLEGEAYGLLLEGRSQEASAMLRRVSDLYRRSWETAPPRSYGRLVGMLKAAILAGDAREAASQARRELGDEADSPSSWYAVALATLVEGDDKLARRAADGMHGGSDAFDRTGDAIAALADRDAERYGQALAAIVADFESRAEHLTGVPIADTALVLQRLADARGIRGGTRSPVLPDR